MKLLVIFAAFLTVCSACGTYTPHITKVESFNCPAPNGKGLQAALDEFDKYREEDLPYLADSYALRKIVEVFLNKMLGGMVTDEWIKARDSLQTYLCEKVFVDGKQYYGILNTVVLSIYSQKPSMPTIYGSQFREDFYKFVNKIYSSEKYKRSREILDYYTAHEAYAQLGMQELHSNEMKKLIDDLMTSGPFPTFFEMVEDYGIKADDVVDLFVYLALSSWDYVEK